MHQRNWHITLFNLSLLSLLQKYGVTEINSDRQIYSLLSILSLSQKCGLTKINRKGFLIKISVPIYPLSIVVN